MKLLNKLNTLSVHLLTLAGALAIASALVNIVTAVTMLAVDKLDNENVSLLPDDSGKN